jgi:hypothetical protein
MFTVIDRSSTVDKSSRLLILEISWRSIGLILILSASGTLIALGQEPFKRKLVLLATLAAGLLVIVGQVNEQTAWSLDKHLAYSGWFAAIGAGYGVSRALKAFPGKEVLAVSCCAIALVFPAIQGEEGAWGTFHLWANGQSFLRSFVSLAAHTSGNFYLSSGTTIGQYYTKQGIQLDRWRCSGISLELGGHPSTWEAYYTQRLRADNCNLVVLFYKTTLAAPGLPDEAILGPSRPANRHQLLDLVAEEANPPAPGLSSLTVALEDDRAYRLVATGPYNGSASDGLYAIWQRKEGAQ